MFKHNALPSVITSLNHKAITLTVNMNPSNKREPPFSKPWKLITPDTAINNKEKLANKGQGDWSTKWKGKNWKLFLFVIKLIYICKTAKFTISDKIFNLIAPIDRLIGIIPANTRLSSRQLVFSLKPTAPGAGGKTGALLFIYIKSQKVG